MESVELANRHGIPSYQREREVWILIETETTTNRLFSLKVPKRWHLRVEKDIDKCLTLTMRTLHTRLLSRNYIAFAPPPSPQPPFMVQSNKVTLHTLVSQSYQKQISRPVKSDWNAAGFVLPLNIWSGQFQSHMIGHGKGYNITL